jgi:hypothetical protein
MHKVLTRLQFGASLDEIIQGIGVLRSFLCRATTVTGNDKGHNVLGFDVFAFGLELQSDLYRGHGIAIWIIFRIFTKLLPKVSD